MMRALRAGAQVFLRSNYGSGAATGRYHLRERVVETPGTQTLILYAAPHHPLTQVVLSCDTDLPGQIKSTPKKFPTSKFTRRIFRFRIVTLIPVLTWHLHSLTLEESSF